MHASRSTFAVAALLERLQISSDLRPGFTLADKGDASFKTQGIRSRHGDHAIVRLAVLGIQKVALPLVVTGLGSSGHDHGSDLTSATLILNRDNFAAELPAAIIEIHLRTR